MYGLVKWSLIVLISISYLVATAWFIQSQSEWSQKQIKPRRVTWLYIELFSIPAFALYFFVANYYFNKNQ